MRTLVAGLRDIAKTLADADPENKAELHSELGVTSAGFGVQPPLAQISSRTSAAGMLLLGL